MFKQNKKHISNFMIEFEALAMKVETDDIHVIFLLRKNIWTDIIKIILKYPPIAVSRSLTVDFIHFYFLSFILFSLPFIFYFLFLEQLGLGVISHAVTAVTI